MKKNYSLKWNHGKKAWIAKVKKKDGSWGNKQIPKEILETMPMEAEHWLLSWLLNPEKAADPQATIRKTLKDIIPMWLEYRKEDIGTKPDTYRGFLNSVKHMETIKGFDIKTELNTGVVKSWLSNDMKELAYTSKLDVLSCLRVMINQSIAQMWLDQDLDNVTDKPAVKELEKKFRKLAMHAVKSKKNPVRIGVVRSLLEDKSGKVKDFRKVRYLLAYVTGLRSAEVAGLRWSDVKVPKDVATGENIKNGDLRYLNIDRQLMNRGSLPVLQYEDLIMGGISKDKIPLYPNAIVSNPKRDSSRNIPIHNLLNLVLIYWWERGWQLEVGRAPTLEDPIFPRNRVSCGEDSRAGDYYFPDDSACLGADLRRVGITHTYEFKSFRSGFATKLNDLGIEESKVGALLGHAASSVTGKNYIKHNLILMAEVINRIGLRQIYLSTGVITLAPECV